MPANPYLEIGHRIRDAREEAGLQQIQLAELLGVVPATMNLIEKGKRKVTIVELQTISSVLKKHLAWFLTGEDTSPRSLRSDNRNIPPEAQKEIYDFIAYIWTKYGDK